MNNLKQLFALLLLTLTYGCSKEVIVTPVVKEASLEEERLGRILEDISNGSHSLPHNFYYNLKFDTLFGRPDMGRQTQVGFKLNQSGFQLPINELKPLIEEAIERWNMTRDIYDPKNAIHLQFFAFELGHRAARRESNHPQAKQIMVESMRTLYTQKAIDTDAMAELLIEIKNELSNDEYILYSEYISNIAYDDIADFEVNWKQVRDEMHSHKDDIKLEQIRVYINAKHMLEKYHQGKRALEILSFIDQSRQ